MNPHPPPASTDVAQPARWWSRLHRAHFHDYTPASLRMFLAIVGVGGIALGLATLGLLQAPALTPLVLLVALALVAVAAWFPIEVPRSNFSLGGADAFIYVILAVLGLPAAVLAAGLEGAIGALRSTRRWTSRISTPAAAMAAMAIGGTLFEWAWPLLTHLGLSPALAKLAVLPVVALVPFTLASLPLISIVTLKRGQWPDVRDWLASSSWMLALNVGAGLIAGMVQMSTAGQGLASLAIIGTVTLGVLLLLSISARRIEAAHQRQEVRIQDAKREAELNQQRFAASFAGAAVGMAIVDADGAVVRANPAFCALLRRAEPDLLGQPFVALVHEDDRAALLQQTGPGRAGVTDNAALELRCNAGHAVIRVELYQAPFHLAEGTPAGLIYQLLDVTSRHAAEQRLHHIAYHDSLTNLANRAGFVRRVTAAVERSRIEPAAQFAVVFLDLDRFKVVNDSLGHGAGNELLRELARRLAALAGPQDLVARLGGDEFGMLFSPLLDKAGCLAQVEAMLQALAHPVIIRGHEIVPQASAGVTFSDLGYRNVEELLRDADLAMYEAKGAGRGRLAVYDRSMHDHMADKLALEADLRRAIAEDELRLAFQPLYELNSGRLTGFEALTRWTHPERGPIAPAVFIALAEESGHIEALTRWALDTALRHLTSWHAAAPAQQEVGVSVNLSGHDLARPRLVEDIMALLRRHAVAPHLLTLELTETVLMADMDQAAAALGRLHGIGVRMAIDDFGTGYSSLAYLGKLPIDCLKIDRSFVQAMDDGADGLEIIRAVANLGRALRKKVVAEGIETDAQLQALRRLGVDLGQGFLLSRPVMAEHVNALLITRSETLHG